MAGMAQSTGLLRPPLLPAQPHRCTRQTVRARRQVTTKASLAPNYGYVLGSVAVTTAVVQWMSIRVALARRDSGVKYPKMYADGEDETAMVFNCTQRAHQNTLENLPSLLGLELALGTVHPITAASCGLIWSIGRIIYMLGYSTGDPSKRLPGVAISSLTQLGLMVATLVVGARALLA